MAWEGADKRKEAYPKNWVAISKQILARDNYTCQLGSRRCTGVASQVDHISGDKDDNTGSNLQAVCVTCHAEKSSKQGNDAKIRPNPREKPVSPGVLEEKSLENHLEEFEEVILTAKPKGITQTMGPMWQKNEDGTYKLPEKTLGWYIIAWVYRNLRHKSAAFKLTGEQARFILWFYSLNEKGEWLFEKGFKVAPKGWGKDPLAAVLLAVEFVGPCRFDGWKTDGTPKVKDNPQAWCQIAAVSKGQNKNTMIYLKTMFSEELIVKYNIRILAESIFAEGDSRRIESVSSASRNLEGNFPSFAICSEIHHWLKSNGCAALWSTIERNLRKTAGTHMVAITNTYNPGENSIAQQQIENYMDFIGGRVADPRVLMDFLYATEDAPYKLYEDRIKVLKIVYGDSTWVDLGKIARSFDDASVDVSELLRFHYNSISVSSDVWVNIRDWDDCAVDATEIPNGSRIVLAGDMSLNDDSTALIGIVVGGLLDGVIFNVGIWEKPPRSHGDAWKNWQAPREEIDEAVKAAFLKYKVVAFWCDPSHKKDEKGSSYWKPLINEWHVRYSKKIQRDLWAQPNQAINWDMTSSARQKEFVEALDSLEQEISDNTIRHTKDATLRTHVQNARRVKNISGHTIGKSSSQSKDKIDGAVTAVIAYLLYTKIRTSRKTKASHLKAYTTPAEMK